MEELIKDYLDFVADLDDSVINQSKEFKKTERLTKHYCDVRANHLKSFEELKNEVMLGYNQIAEGQVTSLEEVRNEFDGKD